MFLFWNQPPAVEVQPQIVFQLNNLEVLVDPTPIGGNRGKVGTLTIGHKEHKVFTEWTEDDLKTLARLTQQTLKIHEDAHVHNTLIYGRQDKDKPFKMSFVPYPKCNWIEKIRGLIHVIFGSPALQQKQVDEISAFYHNQFRENFELAAQEVREVKMQDPFCKPEVIEKQLIFNSRFSEGEENFEYDLLHDHCPKGRTKQDPHFLIVPQGDRAHEDGSQVSQKQRLHLFQITQKAMRVLDLEQYPTFLYLERNGSQLQGVQHKHSHVMGIKKFPESSYEKGIAFIRQLWPSRLSKEELNDCTLHYSQHRWEVN